MSTKTFSVFKAMFMPMLQKLDEEYWCTHCGVDGYLYLLFQRRFFRLSVYMTLISFIAQIIVTVLDQNANFRIFGFIDKQDAIYSLSEEKAWGSIIVIFVFTLLTVRIV